MEKLVANQSLQEEQKLLKNTEIISSKVSENIEAAKSRESETLEKRKFWKSEMTLYTFLQQGHLLILSKERRLVI